MNPRLRFDAYLTSTNAQLLQSMARVWGDKRAARKDACIAAITRGLNNNQRIQAVIAGLPPYVRLAMELAKQNQGEVDAARLLLMLKLTGLALPDLDDYEGEIASLGKHLIRQGVFLSRAPLPTYYYYSSSSQQPTILFSDERLLAYVDLPCFDPLPLSPVDPPATTTQRRPSTVILNILGILQAIADQDGLKLTKSGVFQVNSLRKLLKAQKWQEDAIEVDGFRFPQPGLAFAEALRYADLLTYGEDNTLVLAQSIEAFAARSYPDQMLSLLLGFVQAGQWGEWNPLQWHNAEQFTAGREVLVTALKLLPFDDAPWFSVNDLEKLMFDRVGEHFSLVIKRQRPRHFGNNPQYAQQELDKWRETLRQEWLSRERFWIKYALSTWLYYLGLVELGLGQPEAPATTTPQTGRSRKATPAPQTAPTQNDAVVCFRLTPLGRAVLHSQQQELVEAIETTSQASWIVQPNFEVMVYLDQVTPMQLAFLERHSERIDVQQHMAQYRLTRDSVYRGLESGSSLDELLTTLQIGSRVPVPQNVQTDLRQWSQLREEVTLRQQARLLEFPDAKTCQAAIDRGITGSVIGDRFILLSGAPTITSWVQSKLDYAQPLPQCLAIDETGTVQLTPSSDFLIETQLQRWMEPQPDGSWQLTRTSVTKAIKAGAKAADLFDFLQERLTHPLPMLLGEAIQSWTGNPATVELESVLVLRCTDPNVFRAIAKSKKLKPYLVGQLAPGVLLVHAAKLSTLRRELDWVGFEISEQLLNLPKP